MRTMRWMVMVLGLIAAFPCAVYLQSPSTIQRQRAINSTPENDLMRRMTDMRALEGYARRRSELDRQMAGELRRPELSKETVERVRQMRTINPADARRFDVFLKQPKTGIFRIFPFITCNTPNVVNIGDVCENYVPESNDFAFRSRVYSDRMFHDIGFENERLNSASFLSQGIFIDLGKVPIDSVNIETPSVQKLWNAPTAKTFSEAKEKFKLYTRGFEADGVAYATSIAPVAERTFVLRVVAYDHDRKIGAIGPDSTMNEVKFKSLSLDERDDILIAFRIVRVAVDGGLTIVWKELDRRKAPKLKFAKNDRLEDFK